MGRDNKIKNAFKRSDMHRKSKREKEQDKLKRRMEIRKAEKNKEVGAELKRERLAKNVPRTIDNTRVYDSSSYLTTDPTVLRAKAEQAALASQIVNQLMEEGEEDSEDSVVGQELDQEAEQDQTSGAGPSQPRTDFQSPEEDQQDHLTIPDGGQETAEVEQPVFQPPPKIMVTTSPSPCKETYDLCEDLTGIFPGGEFFKRPRGKGFEIGRIARWAAKRGFGAVLVVNEDHKIPNALTIMRLPAGPTAYFKLTSTTLGKKIYGHARPSPHSPELILNGFTTLLGNSVGELFASLFPPQPQFRGRQVVTLHNQRDFLFFRRHRYIFDSVDKASLQEIGPRFTLKLRWLKKGLPPVTNMDGRTPGADQADVEEKEGKPNGEGDQDGGMVAVIPALDDEQEYEWKWKPKMEVSRRTFFL